jgi:CubicO group peptidase (beta-lactamase class C family)
MLSVRLARAFSVALLLAACGASEKENGGNGTPGGSPGHAGADGGGKGDTGGAGAAAGTGALGGGGDAGQGGNGNTLTGCELERAELERGMAQKLDAAAVDEGVTAEPNFTLVLETDSGHRFVHTHGDSSLTKSYESASTSKWVAAAVILDLVDQGVLRLDDEPSLYLPFWQASGVNLAELLSFTSGFSKEPLCFNLPNADFADCVQRAYEANVDLAPPPGSEFFYSSTHLQIAGLMAVRAASVSGFADLFSAWQAKTALFPSGAFDLPSAENPRLAGGMHWTAAEYLEFLRALYDGKLLSKGTRQAMLTSQRGDAKVASSPALDALDQDWAYGFGNWLECPTAQGPDSYDCGSGHRNSSPGAYGAYPFIDWDRRYFGILARQGKLGTFRDGDSLFQTIAEDAGRWASLCSP